MNKLRLSPDLVLPEDFATAGVGIIGMRGSGKSNTEVRFAEILFDAGIPWVSVDPKGDWDGIRTSADGKKAGLPIPVFGGLRGDFPLDANAGKVIADLLVDENISAVLDVSHLSKTVQLPRFLVAFFDELMHRHQLEPHVRTVILEEAHRYIPQKVDAKMALLKEAAAAVLLEGRAFGLGCWACSQRPARINKDVLEEVGTLFVHRIGVAAGNDKKTVRDWVKHEELGEELVDSLTKLQPGECWVLAPEYDIVKRVQIDRRHTFDSAATPKVGAQIRRPTTMADIDKGAITEALAESIEKAKSTDPKLLAQRVRELERTIMEYEKELEKSKAAQEPEPVPYVPPELLTRLGKLEHGLSDLIAEAHNISCGVNEAVDDARAALIAAEKVAKSRAASDDTRRRESPKPVASTRRQSPRAAGSPSVRSAQPSMPAGSDTNFRADDLKLGKGEKKVLAVLRQWPEGRTQKDLHYLTGYSASSSTLGVYLSKLRQAGVVEEGHPIRLTEKGWEVAGGVEELPAGEELLEYWRNHKKVGEGERKVLDVLVKHYPTNLEHQELCDFTGYSPTASTVGVYLSHLRKLGIVEKGERRLAAQFAEAVGL